MVNISKPISAGQVKQYYKADFANARENYYTEGATVRGEWHGQLAARWGLEGAVDDQQFARLAEGRHPITGEQLVRHQKSVEYINTKGETVRTMEHRAAYDATFSAPKSVSLTALVGGDERVRRAHRESVRVALGELEKYTQARIGGDAPAETTGAWVAALFEHDSARPVEGQSAPQLHTHVPIFNIAEGADGTPRALQPREAYKAQQYITAVYRSDLAVRLQALGYEIERGEYGQPEIKGYTREYLEASSPRRQQIVEHMDERGYSSVSAARVAAHDTRSAKQNLPREEVLAQHLRMAAEYGNQPQQVVAEAMQRPGVELDREQARRVAVEAIAHARERSMERSAVTDERAVLRDALKHSMGAARLPEVRAEFEHRVQAQELIEVAHGPGEASRMFTMPEMQTLERENIERMRAGQNACAVLVAGESRTWAVEWAQEQEPKLSPAQQTAVEEVLTSRDRLTALDGVAGAGKTTTLKPINVAAVRQGYVVTGLAPTSRAAQELGKAGMETETLQMHLTHGERRDDGQQRLYVVDEASMVSTAQMHAFLERLKENDRVLFVGDTRQHEAVDAGRPYSQLQGAGMRTAHLEEIVRQKDPALKKTVGQLARGEVREAVASLIAQGRVHEIEDRNERIREIAREYVRQPESTLVVSPDNQSRREINECIHRAMQDADRVWSQEHTVRVLQQRHELTGADRMYARNYEVGNVLRYAKSSKALGIEAGEYVQVARTDEESNTLTVLRKNGEELSYDPRRLQGVTVYQEAERAFAEGDRVQMTAAYHPLSLANRELGTVEQIDDEGNLKLRMDSKRDVEFNVRQMPHLDYGYAVTSHSSQSQTSDRVLIHVDSEQASGQLLNSRMAYVSVSRARQDAQIFTNDAASLAYELSRDVTHSTALEHEPIGLSVEPHSEAMDEMMQQGLSMEIGH